MYYASECATRTVIKPNWCGASVAPPARRRCSAALETRPPAPLPNVSGDGPAPPCGLACRMLVLHHSVRNAMVIMGFLKRDIFTLKHGVVYDTFAMYEVALFATLAARRLQVAQRAVVAIWWFGMGKERWPGRLQRLPLRSDLHA